MEDIINIEYPRSLANSLRMSETEFEKEMKISALVKLYEMEKISSGTAAKVLDISRIDFLELLSKYKISPFGEYEVNEIIQDMNNAKSGL